MLVGRADEERLIDVLLDSARAGRSGVLAFVGEAGVGKSALLDHAVGQATGMVVLRARGVQSEGHTPFGGLFELLRPALDHLGALAGRQREALEGALALRPSQGQDRFAVGAATLNLLAAVAETAPLLVVVDDAHWIDGSSADALLFAFRRLLADPVAVVVGVREGQPSLVDGSDLAVHRVGGLDRNAAAELIAQHAAGPTSEDVIDRLHQGTGGNPLALVELAADATRVAAGDPFGGPLSITTSVGDAYVERAAVLPEAARDLLVLAAASDTGDLSVLSRAAALAGLDLADLAAAEATGLVQVVDERVQFRHPLARSAVYAAALPERRRAVHRALAQALPDVQADRRAWHLALAALGPDDAASSALEQAARRARDRSAYDVASQAYERAVGLAPEHRRACALLRAAAESAWLAGMADRAVALLEEARRRDPPPEIAVAVEQLRGHIATRMGPVGEGRRILLAGAEAAAEIDPDRAVVMLAEAVNAAFYSGDSAAMLVAARRIPPLLGPASGRQALFLGRLAEGMALIFGGEDEERGADLLHQALQMVDGSDELSGDPRLLAWAAMGPLWLREPDAASLGARALDAARQQSVVGVLPFLVSHVAIEAMASERWGEAEAGFHEAIALARETGQRTDLAFALARLSVLEARQGREEVCRAHVAEAQVLAHDLDVGLGDLWALGALADLDVALGRTEEAVAQLEHQRSLLDEQGVGDVDLSPEPELAELYMRLGRRDEAEACLASFAPRAAHKGQPWALARAERCRGLLAEPEGLDGHFAAALELHAATPDVFETARTRLAYGGRLRRTRRRTRAREQLRQAIEDFDRLGAVPWSEMARTELAATGESARRRDPSTRDDLTPQELQISLLLAAGRTTREAAAAMFLSPKTIEHHLRSVYRKLGINSREQLAATLSDQNI